MITRTSFVAPDALAPLRSARPSLPGSGVPTRERGSRVQWQWAQPGGGHPVGELGTAKEVLGTTKEVLGTTKEVLVIARNY